LAIWQATRSLVKLLQQKTASDDEKFPKNSSMPCKKTAQQPAPLLLAIWRAAPLLLSSFNRKLQVMMKNFPKIAPYLKRAQKLGPTFIGYLAGHSLSC
jgi:hypothetical protein